MATHRPLPVELQVLLALPVSGEPISGSPISKAEPLDTQLRSAEQPLVASLRTALGTAPIAVRCLALPATHSDKRCQQILRDAVRALPSAVPLVVGGFSRGGRIAALCISPRCISQLGISPLARPQLCIPELQPVGFLAWGYPFHRLGAPQYRHGLQALQNVKVPTLIVQGDRDPHGNSQTIRGYRALPGGIPPHISVHPIANSKHRFASGQPCDEAVAAMLPFLTDLLVSRRA